MPKVTLKNVVFIDKTQPMNCFAFPYTEVSCPHINPLKGKKMLLNLDILMMHKCIEVAAGNFVFPGAVGPIELLSPVIHWFPGILGISPTIYNPCYPSMPCHNWVCSIPLTVCEMEHQSLLIQDHWPTMNGNRIIWDSWVNTMAANALAPFILRSSIIVLLKM